MKIFFSLFFLIALGCGSFVRAQKTKINLLSDTLWTYSLNSLPSEIPLIDENFVFVGGDRAPVVCLDRTTGKEKWKLDVQIEEYHKGFIHTIRDDKKGNIYFNGTSKNVLAVKKSNGHLNWKYETKFDDDIFAKIIVSNDTLFVNPVAPEFLALSTHGKEFWKTGLSSVCMGFVMDESRIFCMLGDGALCVLDRKNGKVINSFQAFPSRGKFSVTPVTLNKSLVVCNGRDTVIGYDRNTLKEKWMLTGMKAVYEDNKSVFTYNDTLFQRIDDHNGKTVWKMQGDFRWYLQPTIFGNFLYLQTRRFFYIIDNLNGRVLYFAGFPDKSYTKPQVKDGIIYVGFSGKIAAIKHPATK
jgi:outer membrane protein assembly factor BamB